MIFYKCFRSKDLEKFGEAPSKGTFKGSLLNSKVALSKLPWRGSRTRVISALPVDHQVTSLIGREQRSKQRNATLLTSISGMNRVDPGRAEFCFKPGFKIPAGPGFVYNRVSKSAPGRLLIKIPFQAGLKNQGFEIQVSNPGFESRFRIQVSTPGFNSRFQMHVSNLGFKSLIKA